MDFQKLNINFYVMDDQYYIIIQRRQPRELRDLINRFSGVFHKHQIGRKGRRKTGDEPEEEGLVVGVAIKLD